jgi:hypothetical protein
MLTLSTILCIVLYQVHWAYIYLFGLQKKADDLSHYLNIN